MNKNLTLTNTQQRRMRILSLLFISIFCFQLTFAQGHEKRLAEIDVQHYKFSLTLHDDKDDIEGEAKVKIKFSKSVGLVTLDLTRQNETKKGMLVAEVLEEGKAIEFSQDIETLTFKPKGPVAANDIRTFTIKYSGIPADGLIISKNASGDRTFFGDNWPNRAHNWLPCVDHPSDKSTVEFLVTAPLHYQIIANGQQIEESNVDNGMKLTHWKTNVILPMKVVVIGAADFAVQHAGEVKGVPVSSWIFRQQRNDGFFEYGQGVQILEWFIKTAGEYPYEKLANVQSRTRYGGMENASCIFYSESSVQGDRSSEALMAHEIAHQWFGNSASEANWHHIWLSEGFATYWTHLYFEQTHNIDTFNTRLKMDRLKVVNYKNAFKSPVVDPSVTDYNMLLNANSYQKGGWVLHMLRQKIGDKAFFAGMKQYYEKFKFGNAFTADLREAMESASGKGLTSFFEQWVFTAGHPILKVDYSFSEKKKEMTLVVEQVQEGALFEFPLEFGFFFEGRDQAYKTFEVSGKKSKFKFSLPATPKRTDVDPQTKLLFEMMKK